MMADMQDPASTEIGTKVRKARESAGLSQQTLATKAGVAIRTLIRIEQGEDTKVGTLTLVSTALGLPVADLVSPAPATSGEAS